MITSPPSPTRAKVVHPLINIVTTALRATIAGADDSVAMAAWARRHTPWLGQFLDLSAGIPSHDRLNMVFRHLDPAEFERRLLAWLAALHDTGGGSLVAIGGKALRRSFDKATARSALLPAGARAVSQRLSLGSVAVERKSDEITAIPRLLELIELSGAIVTIDAMGCQTEIARAIVEGGGDSTLAVKGNRPTLHEGLMGFFAGHSEDDFAGVSVSRHETDEKAHGRTERRSYYVCDIPAGLADAKRWAGLVQVGVAIGDTRRGGKSCDDVRYYILSRRLSARRFGTLVRGHSGIESMHWQLDVSFGEGEHRTRERTLGNNLSRLRRFAVTLLKRHPDKDSLRGKMLSCMMGADYLSQVMSLQQL